MRLTKFTHACVRLEDGDRVLVVDPGVWTEPEAVDGADAILVTHEHNDHVDGRLVLRAYEGNPDLRLYGPAPVAAAFDGLGENAVPVAVGDAFEAAGFTVTAYGGRHAAIWEDRPDVPNLGYLIGGTVFVPGDSLEPPGVAVDTLFVPVHASWMKIGEAIAFTRAVAPRRAHPIHDGQMAERGWTSADSWLSRESGAAYERLTIGETVEL